jgi:hypothetical protein
MAVGAQQILLAAVPVTCPSAVNSLFPIPQFRPVTLAAEFVGFVEAYQFSACCVEHISIVCIMTVHAPSVFFVVPENDIIMKIFQFSTLIVDFYIRMTIYAGEYSLA